MRIKPIDLYACRNAQMSIKIKKKFKFIILSLILVLFAGLFLNEQISASGQSLSSKGVLILKDGADFAFYADDVYYLQRELDALFNEIK